MKPPYCHFCHRALGSASDAEGPVDGLVKFADYVPLPPGMPGHPRGLEWFCKVHFASAQALATKTTSEAMTQLSRGALPSPKVQAKPPAKH